MTMDQMNDAPLASGSDMSVAFAETASMTDFDASRYLGDVADFDLTEAEKIELLRTLWSIMRACVELGFRMDVCGQVFGQAGIADAVRVESASSTTGEKSRERGGKRIE